MTAGTQTMLLCGNWKWMEKWQKHQMSEEHPDSSKPLPFLYEVSPHFFHPCPGVYQKPCAEKRRFHRETQASNTCGCQCAQLKELEWKMTGMGALIQARV